MNLSQLLKGMQLLRDADGKIVVQTIRNMTLVFLTCDPQYSLDNKFANPTQSVKVSNRSYGHLNIQNATDKDLIVAPQIAVMNDYQSQNHAMTKSAIIRALKAQDYNDAGCVQGSQGGTISASRENRIRFVPVSVREMLLEQAAKPGGYSRIYPAIEKLGQRTGVQTGYYLDKYFRRYDPETTEFIAHFERPDKCIGVVVLVDGEIVAIDKFPSYAYTAQVWDLLIRDCYGSLAIESQVKGKVGRKWFTEVLSGYQWLVGEDNVDRLLDVLDHTEARMAGEVEDRLREVMTVDFRTRQDTDTGGEYNSHILESDGYIGQIIASGEYFHVVSLVKRDKFDPAVLRQRVAVVDQYRRLSQEQREFAL